MTTPQAEMRYLAEHLARWADKGYAVFNPNNKPLEELPVIYGFNNGGSKRWSKGILLAEDGTKLGEHTCSDEAYMPHDLGILEGSRPDKHEEFKEHYSKGYRMDFVGYADVKQNEGLMKALKLVEARNERDEHDEKEERKGH